MWRQIDTISKGRWWFFWNFVVRGKALSFQIWAKGNDETKIRIDVMESSVSMCKGIIKKHPNPFSKE